MKKFRNLLYNSFFTQIANIGIIIVFSLIIAVQIYKLYLKHKLINTKKVPRYEARHIHYYK